MVLAAASTSSAICIVITGPALSQAREQVLRAKEQAELLEFRLDQFTFDEPEAVRHLMEAAGRPVIFTLRSRRHGGGFSGDEQARLERVEQLAKLRPRYFDLEYDADEGFYRAVADSSETEVICSYHNFSETPEALQQLFEVMQQREAAVYKISVMANSALDALRMLRFLRDNRKKGHRLIGVCMGEAGISSRILGAVYGSCLFYATLSDGLKTAPGQMTAHELNHGYRFPNLSPKTAVYGLVGDPVRQSPSHKSHNRAMERLGLDALFVKFAVPEKEFESFIELAKKLDIKGVAVTLPHKERAAGCLTRASEDAERIGAVNTLKFDGKEIEGMNSDGRGALNVLEKHGKVKGKKVVILGAGGAAKAVADEAHRRGARLIILNRTLEKGQQLAGRLGAEAASLDAFCDVAKEGYDILINCTSLGMYPERPQLPVDCRYLLPKRLVLDAVPAEGDTPFISEAKKRECTIISGYAMLRAQAVEQFLFWFDRERGAVEEALDADRDSQRG